MCLYVFTSQANIKILVAVPSKKTEKESEVTTVCSRKDTFHSSESLGPCANHYAVNLFLYSIYDFYAGLKNLQRGDI